MIIELLQTLELIPPVEIHAPDESPARDSVMMDSVMMDSVMMDSTSPPTKWRRVRARRASQHSHAHTPVRVVCLPLKHCGVDTLFKSASWQGMLWKNQPVREGRGFIKPHLPCFLIA